MSTIDTKNYWKDVQTFLLTTHSHCGQKSLINKHLDVNIIQYISQYLKFPIKYLPQATCYMDYPIEFSLDDFMTTIIPFFHKLTIKIQYLTTFLLVVNIQKLNNSIQIKCEGDYSHANIMWNNTKFLNVYNDTFLLYTNSIIEQSLLDSRIPKTCILKIQKLFVPVRQCILNSIDVCLNKLYTKHKTPITQDDICKLNKELAHQCLLTYNNVS